MSSRQNTHKFKGKKRKLKVDFLGLKFVIEKYKVQIILYG